jgi:hypothetical protein
MGGEDKVALPWMAKFTRNPVPTTVVWHQGGTTTQQMYWLAVPKDKATAGAVAIAVRDGQTITLTKAEKLSTLLVRLDDRMANLDDTITIKHDGKVFAQVEPKRTIATLLKTLAERGDPELMFSSEVKLDLSK